MVLTRILAAAAAALGHSSALFLASLSPLPSLHSTQLAFLSLLVLVALLRLLELRISRRNRLRLSAQGARRAPDPVFPWMVLLHAAILLGAALEVVFLRRPFIPVLALVAAIFFLAANALRWWVISSLGAHWNVQIVDTSRLGFVSSGPYRWLRHPNYLAVFVEMLALPLLHAAWLTAALGAIAHLFVLSRRVRAEDAVLLANPAYRAAMGSKPRFFPRLFPRASSSRRSAFSGDSAR